MRRFFEWIATGIISVGLFLGISLPGQPSHNEVSSSQLKKITQNTPIILEQSSAYNMVSPFWHSSHYSHGSHGSHSSHSSHYSSR